jgi:hypothetical protein
MFPAVGAFAEDYFLPQIANGSFGGGSFRTTFILFNNSDSDLSASIRLTDDDGRPLSLTLDKLGTAAEFSVFLSAGGTQILQTDGAGDLITGAAVVSSPGAIGVSAIFTVYDPQGNYVTEAGVSSSAPVAEFVLPVDRTGLSNTGVALFNAAGGNAVVNLTLRDTNGQTAAQTSLNLEQNAHRARFVAGAGELFPAIPAGFRGTLAVQSNAPIAALGLRQNETPLSYTSLPVVESTANRLAQNFSHVANGAHDQVRFKTSFLLFNISPAAANVVLSLTKDDGTPMAVAIEGRGTSATFNIALAPGASAFLQTTGEGALTQGAAAITSTAPVGASAIFTVFDSAGRFLTEAGVGHSPALNALTIPVEITGSADTGIAFFNPGSTGMTLGLKLLDANGGLTGLSATVELEAKRHVAKFVSELFGVSAFKGSVSVAAPAGVSALTLRQNAAPLSYTTLPVAAGFASGKALSTLLLSKTRTDVDATAEVAVDEVLPAGFRLSGQSDSSGQTYFVMAQRDDGTVFGSPVDAETGVYTIALPAGAYQLKSCFQPSGVSGRLALTHLDPGVIQVSADTTRNVLPSAVPLFRVSGAISGLSALPSGDVRVVFTSTDNTVEGEFNVLSNGSYEGALPNGSYVVSLSAPTITFDTQFQTESLALFNVGSVTINGEPINASFSVPPIAEVTGGVRASWLGAFFFGKVSASDRSASLPTAVSCALPFSQSSAAAPPPGNYRMILGRDRSYNMSVTVPLLEGSRTIGVVGYPVPPGVLDVAGATSHNFNLPDLPGQVRITGRVTDEQGRAVRGATVAAFSQDLSNAPGLSFSGNASTDAAGNYSLPVVSGRYRLIFFPPQPEQ